MFWKKYSLVLSGAHQEDPLAALLYSLGVEGVEIEDGRIPSEAELGRMFVDLSPELAPDEMPTVSEPRIHFYLRVSPGEEAAPQTEEIADDSYTIHDKLWLPEEEQQLLARLQEGWEKLFPGAPFHLEEDLSREEDWRDNWKQYYQPLLVEDLLILPVWEDLPAEYAQGVEAGAIHPIRLDPGTAFGSGSHESTRLCLEGLKKWMKGSEKVLDIGCGSGILGLAALAYGAERICATELDPACKAVVAENLEINGVDQTRFEYHEGNLLTEPELIEGQYDLILCNILAPVIEALAAPGAAERYAKPGALFISSGIYKEHRRAVERAFRSNPAWEWVETVEMNDWVSVVARRKPY
ncbi:MAG: 50S ribosomal protein L11 methyltransferase [Lachnospiraceae bacterium]|nr:50S ribosomal protein L11 methyltransferase [Lachnospiraceae bacterium]